MVRRVEKGAECGHGMLQVSIKGISSWYAKGVSVCEFVLDVCACLCACLLASDSKLSIAVGNSQV